MSVLEQILRDIRNCEIEMEEAGISCLCPAWVEAIIKKHLSAENMSDSANDGWIPVDKGLPEDLKDVLVDFGDECPTIAWYSEKIKMWEDSKAGSIIRGVVAWRPLPEPYKPEKEDAQRVIGTEFFHKRFMEVK